MLVHRHQGLVLSSWIPPCCTRFRRSHRLWYRPSL